LKKKSKSSLIEILPSASRFFEEFLEMKEKKKTKANQQKNKNLD
jgi:hypothetical protein